LVLESIAIGKMTELWKNKSSKLRKKRKQPRRRKKKDEYKKNFKPELGNNKE
jgi:hypothetical protein